MAVGAYPHRFCEYEGDGDVPAVSRHAFASERGVSVAMIQLHLKMLVEGKE